MNRPRKIRIVFAELSQVIGNIMSQTELLECASLMVEACDDTLTGGGVYLHDGRPALCELPVYEVIDKWPWELVRDEYIAPSTHDMCSSDDYMDHIPFEYKFQEMMRT